MEPFAVVLVKDVGWVAYPCLKRSLWPTEEDILPRSRVCAQPALAEEGRSSGWITLTPNGARNRQEKTNAYWLDTPSWKTASQKERGKGFLPALPAHLEVSVSRRGWRASSELLWPGTTDLTEGEGEGAAKRTPVWIPSNSDENKHKSTVGRLSLKMQTVSILRWSIKWADFRCLRQKGGHKC